MRVIAGHYRGTRLYTPSGMAIRPTSDRLRESIFNIIGPQIRGKRVLDLFAGTGAMGIEALSRGAVHAVFIDNNPQALDLIHRNIKKVSPMNRQPSSPGTPLTIYRVSRTTRQAISFSWTPLTAKALSIRHCKIWWRFHPAVA